MWILNDINRLLKVSFALAVFTLPFQLNEMLYQAEWGRGFLNPYTSIRFFSTEFFLFLAGVFFAIQLFRKEKTWQLGNPLHLLTLMALLVVAFFSITASPFTDDLFHLFLFAKLFGLILFYLLIVNRALPPQTLLKLFVGSMTLQSLLGIFQVLTQSSFGLYFLGEPHLSEEAVHLARVQIGSLDLIRAYGTLPHPNVLGGFLCMSLFLILVLEKIKKEQRFALLLIQSLGLFATFSRSSILALSVALILLSVWHLKHLKKNRTLPVAMGALLLGELSFVLFSRGFNVLKEPALFERWEGFQHAISMIKEYPLGVGWGHYTLFLDAATETAIMPWEYQPVHNVFLLAMAEMGAIGLLTLLFLGFFLFYRLYHKRKTLLTPKQLFKKRLLFAMSLALLIIACFDHYLFTLDQGRWLLLIVFSVSSIFSADPRFIFPLKRLKGR